ncbi:hypothetical protein [Shewanella frigidimarina]
MLETSEKEYRDTLVVGDGTQADYTTIELTYNGIPMSMTKVTLLVRLCWV